MALSMVISSVYSMSLPTGMPMAMPVDFHACASKLLRWISGRGLASDGWIGGDDDSVDVG